MISIKDLSFCYDNKKIFDGLSFDILKGSLTAIFGPNGIGKTTFLKIIADMHKPTSGSVECYSHNIGFLVQRNWLDLSFPITLFDVVSMGILNRHNWIKSISKDEEIKIERALEQVGLLECKERYIGELSGGQFQRMLFARLIVQDPEIILLDEPFSAVDCKTLMYLIEQIQKWHAQKKTILVVLHDFDLVQQYFDECIFIAENFVKKLSAKEVSHELMTQMLFCGKHNDFV